MATPNIVSASYRTDIPAFYAEWFRERLLEGGVSVRNPYGGPDYRVSLAPEDVLGFVFWSRNLKPFQANLSEVARRKIPFTIQMTVTGYPRLLESSTISVDVAINQITRLSEQFGPECVVWRYDPIVLSSVTTADRHIAMFRKVARSLRGKVDECVVSFATVYAKTKRRLDRIGRTEPGFEWWDPPSDRKQELLRTLQGYAVENEMTLSVCAQNDVLISGVSAAKCIDADRLSAVAGAPITARGKGNREGCLCAQSRDIGAYDTCPHGCVYCYAVRAAVKAKAALSTHDPGAPRL